MRGHAHPDNVGFYAHTLMERDHASLFLVEPFIVPIYMHARSRMLAQGK